MTRVITKNDGLSYPPRHKSRGPRIAICFFGITRSLRFTIHSIRSNVIQPAHSVGDVRVFAHLFDQSEIENPLTNEFGALDPEEYRLLDADVVELEQARSRRVMEFFEDMRSHGDMWEDDFRSLRNLSHQLHSLDSVTQLALNEDPDIVAFCRPDLFYHSSLHRHFAYLARDGGEIALMPRWQRMYMGKDGENDRFGIVRGRGAAVAYGRRLQKARDYCLENGPLWSEGLMGFSMKASGIPIRHISTRASRVRFDGTIARERFDPYWLMFAKHKVGKVVRKFGVLQK